LRCIRVYPEDAALASHLHAFQHEKQCHSCPRIEGNKRNRRTRGQVVRKNRMICCMTGIKLEDCKGGAGAQIVNYIAKFLGQVAVSACTAASTLRWKASEDALLPLEPESGRRFW
jgi:hypothetical protein